MGEILQERGSTRFSWLFAIANYAGWPLLTIYGFCMFAYPWYVGNWRHVQEVWDRWQTLNAGALAFVASLLAFNIAKFNENQQRQRDFTAAKAFLPSTLSGLIEYFEESARYLTLLWRTPIPDTAGTQPPTLPKDYREVFSNCIRHADPQVGSYLSSILVHLQVHDARLRDAVSDTTPEFDRVVDKYSLLAYMLRLGELYILVGNVFGFARSEEPFQVKPLTWPDFSSAYSLLGLEIDDFHIDEKMNLSAFTKRWLEHHLKSSAQEQ